MDNLKVLIIVILVIIAIVVILSLLHKREGYGGGSASYQHNYSGVNDSNYNNKRFNECVSSVKFSAPLRKDKRTFGNAYNEYPYNGYYSDQNKKSKFLGCLNICMLNCGIEKKCYNQCVKSCKNI